MTLFEQRISEDDVKAARKKIAAGASLRSAAADIPCAPSTLSKRIKQAEAAEAAALERARFRTGDQRAAHSLPEDPQLRAIASGSNAGPGDVGPVEILRAALLATRANGQPDWPTRVSAAKALAALRPEEVEPKPEQPAEPSIEIFDLPPGAHAVLHRPAIGEAPVSPAEAPSEQDPTSTIQMFYFVEPTDGERTLIGTWSSPGRDRSEGASLMFRDTDDPETAALWRTELSAGRLPQDTENAS